MNIAEVLTFRALPPMSKLLIPLLLYHIQEGFLPVPMARPTVTREIMPSPDRITQPGAISPRWLSQLDRHIYLCFPPPLDT